MTVAGRSPPSRWSWSSTFGAPRIVSSVNMPSLRGELDGSLPGDDSEVPAIEGQHQTSVSLCTGNDRRVGISEWKIGVSPDELANSPGGLVAAVVGERAGLQICKETVQDIRHPRLDEIGD